MAYFKDLGFRRGPILEKLNKLLEEFREQINALGCILTDIRGLPVTLLGFSSHEAQRRFSIFSIYLYSIGARFSEAAKLGKLNLIITEHEDSLVITRLLQKPNPKLIISFLLGRDSPLGLALCEIGRLEEAVAEVFSEAREPKYGEESSKPILSGGEKEVEQVLAQLENDPLFRALTESLKGRR